MSESVKSYNKICGRLCIEMTGSLVSPLSIGSGEQEHTDGDVVFNAKGDPYIPGSSLAGALREYANAAEGEAETNQLFGSPKNGAPGSREDKQSRIFIYDAAIDQAETGIRDGVKLNERKTASHMGKYELQLVEQDAVITLRIEIIEREECLKGSETIREIWEKDLRWIRLWQDGFNLGELRLGAKSRRGYGKIKIEHIRMKAFDMTDKTSYLEWLDWDWGQDNAFKNTESCMKWTKDPHSNKGSRLERCLEVPLQIAGTLLVRTYNTAFARTTDIPDYRQMTAGGKGERATIPGSSWAGAFRSHIAKIAKEIGELNSWEAAQKALEPVFGTWSDTDDRNQDLCASRVVFEETVVEGGHELPTARIAVDRFTGGTVQGALYEEIPWTGGKLRLRIRWKKDGGTLTDKAICGMLLWAIKDLQSGILAIGGETAVGRGICEPQERASCIQAGSDDIKDGTSNIMLDGESVGEVEQRACMKAAALWVKEAAKDMRRQEDGKI